jgi:hypothetical protein
MDPETLVRFQFDEGRKFVTRLALDGVPCTGAFWVKTGEEGRWYLYLATRTVDEKGTSAAYGEVYSVLDHVECPHISTVFDVKLISPGSPIAKDAKRLQDLHRARQPLRLNVSRLGDLSAEEVYIYPAVPMPKYRTKVIGCREVAVGNKTETVRDDIGIVEGMVGEDVFNESWLKLINEKFGSIDEFATRYPSFLLQRTTLPSL